jgi:predicted SnoaL-like aldol condensation-catalyzing enzyme
VLTNIEPGSFLQIAQDFIKKLNRGGEGLEDLIHKDGLRQHNPTIADGFQGLAAALDSCRGRYPIFEVLIGFEAGPYVVLVCAREMSGFQIGIEVFQIIGKKICAHWDNYCHTSQRSVNELRGGSVELKEYSERIIDSLSSQVSSRKVNDFASDFLIGRDLEAKRHFSPIDYKEWRSEEGIFLNRPRELFLKEYGLELSLKYLKVHKVITNGIFALAIVEGVAAGLTTCHFEFLALNRLGIHFRLPIDELVIFPEFRRNANGKFVFPA